MSCPGTGRLAIMVSTGVWQKHLVSIKRWRTLWRQYHIKLFGFLLNSITASSLSSLSLACDSDCDCECDGKLSCCCKAALREFISESVTS